MSVFDMLDIDETEGIDPTEIEAIKATITRIKVAAASVAKHNDTTDSLIILKEMERMVRRVANSGVHSVDELHQQFATNSAGQPARALGAGTDSQPNPAPAAPLAGPTQVREQPMSDDAALHVIMTSTQVPQGVKAGILRMITPSDPNHLPVATDGTPTELVTARKTLADERDDTKNGSLAHKLAKAENELAEEKDENKSGSLAHQLKAAQRNATAPANMVDKTVVLPLVQAVETAAGQLDTHMMSSHIDGADELNRAVAAAKAAVS